MLSHRSYFFQDFEKERENWAKKETHLTEKCDQLRDRAAELQDIVNKLRVRSPFVSLCVFGYCRRNWWWRLICVAFFWPIPAPVGTEDWAGSGRRKYSHRQSTGCSGTIRDGPRSERLYGQHGKCLQCLLRYLLHAALSYNVNHHTCKVHNICGNKDLCGVHSCFGKFSLSNWHFRLHGGWYLADLWTRSLCLSLCRPK